MDEYSDVLLARMITSSFKALLFINSGNGTFGWSCDFFNVFFAKVKLFEYFLAKFSLYLSDTDFFSFVFIFPQTSSPLNYVLSFSQKNKSKFLYCLVTVPGCAHTVWTRRKWKKNCMREGKRNLLISFSSRSQWKALEISVVFSSGDGKQLCLFFSH